MVLCFMEKKILVQGVVQVVQGGCAGDFWGDFWRISGALFGGFLDDFDSAPQRERSRGKETQRADMGTF